MVVLAAVIACVTSGTAVAGVWSKTYNVSLPMTENATRAGLRGEAMAKARDLASGEFGVVILKQVVATDERLLEKVKTVSAGLAKTQVQSETVRNGADGLVLIDYQVVVEIDDSELDRQVEAMNTDAARDQALRNKLRENEVLRAQNEVLRKPVADEGRRQAWISAIEMSMSTGRATASSGVQVSVAPGGLLASANRDPEGAAELARFEAIVMKPLLEAPLIFSIGRVDLEGDGVAVSFRGAIRGWITLMKKAVGTFHLAQRVVPSGTESCVTTFSQSPLVNGAMASEALVLDVQLGEVREYWVLGEAPSGRGGFCVRGDMESVLRLSRAQAKDVSRIVARVARASDLPENWKSRARRDLQIRPF